MMQRTEPTGPPGTGRAPTQPGPLSARSGFAVALLCLAVLGGTVLTGCSLHASKHGFSGSILGHSFSGSKGTLPTGFPSDVPTPDNSRVLGGGGADSHWDVAFAVTGTLAAGTTAYADKLRAAGYTVSNYQAGTTPVAGSAAAGSTATTITASGATFEATNSQWRIQVASGTTSSVTGTGLHAGEFGLNITVLPASSTTTTS